MRGTMCLRMLALCGLLCAMMMMATPARAQLQQAQVVFVCEHGNVKSLIASTLFNQAAHARGLRFRSISRGVRPEAGVPAKIADELKKEGANVRQFKPTALAQADVSSANRVVAIGIDLAEFHPGPTTIMESWADVPPASVDYAASRAVLLRHIDALLDTLQDTTSSRGVP